MQEKFRKTAANLILFGFLGTFAFSVLVAIGMFAKEIIGPLIQKGISNPSEYILYFFVSVIILAMSASVLSWSVKNR
jgi:cellulose synthase/poly-beta-1,6-N-acetylglucosamine synthase-like glycosyltransferase